MKTVGFVKSSMPEESRVALLPGDFEVIQCREQLVFESGYAQHLGVRDDEYRRLGVRVAPRSEMSRVDVLCIPKPDRKDNELFRQGMTIWGWPYIEDNLWCAKAVVELALTVIDFHFMYTNGEFVFHENSRIAGRLGMMHAMVMGRPPERFGKVAMIGKGHLGKGAMEILDAFGIQYALFDSSNSSELLRSIHAFDTVVNCMKWYEEGFLITRAHIARMKKGAFLVDLSTEGIEGSVPHSVYTPVYKNDHVLMYSNNHIPTLSAVYASERISQALAQYVDKVVEECFDPVLEAATVVVSGKATAMTGKLARIALQKAGRVSVPQDSGR